MSITNTIKRSDTGSGGWSNVTSGLSYTLTEADDGKFFRATSRCEDEAEQAINSNSSVVGPVVGPPVVLEKADWKDENIYEIGETIEGRTATYTGGSPSCKFRSRIQRRDNSEESWENSDWVEHSGTEHSYITRVITGPGQFRLMTQAYDTAFDPE